MTQDDAERPVSAENCPAGERVEGEVRPEGRWETLCGVTACTAEATIAIAINIPAIGVPLAEHSPIRIVPGVALCQSCYDMEEASVEDWLDMRNETTKVTVRELVAGVCLQRRLADPDFSRAFVTPLALDSPEFIAVTGGPAYPEEIKRMPIKRMPWTGTKKGR